jgi:hypothetical protein
LRPEFPEQERFEDLRHIRYVGHLNRRAFRRMANLSFATTTCFLLTPSGVAAARRLGHAGGGAVQPQVTGVRLVHCEGNGYQLPHWNADLRKPRLGGLLIKAFKQPARNQVTILAAFEEEGWPRRIYNPLAPPPGQDGKQRLHDAITRLNRHHARRLIHIRSDNNGEGIRWEMVAESPPQRHPCEA